MKKRNEPTLVEKAIEAVPGFGLVFKKLSQQVTLRGQSKSTLNNYIRRIALFVIHVIQYLGQYTHRVAISNNRILSISDTKVTFIAKDYREKAVAKPVILDGAEFLRRFCLHILPKGFVKVRRFGIYNTCTKRNLKLEFGNETIETVKPQNKETVRETLKRLSGIDISPCPVCKKGILIKIRKLPRIRSPGNHLPSLLKACLIQ